LLTYPKADLSLWSLIFNFQIKCSNVFGLTKWHHFSSKCTDTNFCLFSTRYVIRAELKNICFLAVNVTMLRMKKQNW